MAAINPEVLFADLNTALRILSDLFRRRTLDEAEVQARLADVRAAHQRMADWQAEQDTFLKEHTNG